MSKSSPSNALDALATVLWGQGSSLFHSSTSPGGTNQPHVPPPATFANDHHPPTAGAPSWHHGGGRPMDHGRIAQSLVQSGADDHVQDRLSPDWLAVEGAWAAFAVPTRPSSSSSLVHPPPPPPPPLQVAPKSVFDPWAASLAATPHPGPAQQLADSSAHDLESVWSQSTALPARTSQDHEESRIRPIGSRIDDVAEAVWESLTSTPSQPWSWKADVNTARSTPISAHEAQVRAERGRARLGLLARQLGVRDGGKVGRGNSIGEGIIMPEAGRGACSSTDDGGHGREGEQGVGGLERQQQPAK